MSEAIPDSASLAYGSHAFSPPLQRPLRPSAVVPDFLHRANDGWVPLARKVGEQWQELGSVPASQLRGLFADEVMADAVQADGYFGLHAMYRPGRYRTRQTLPSLQPSQRNVNSVRYLNCCHVDLDGYKCGLDTHGMVAAVMRMVDDGMLPPPSLFTLSRGVWAIWRLHDRLNADAPLRAYPESVMSRWCRVQGALTRVCATIGSDAAAKHAASVTRIPGSVNTKNGRAVGYMLPANIHGQPFSYTLDELEAFMRPHFPVVVDATPIRPTPKNPELSARGLSGWRGRWRRLLQALGQLRDMRGGWKLGTRSTALFYVAIALRGLRARGEEVQFVMAQHLAWMEQPIGDKLTMSNAMQIYRSVDQIRGPGASLQTTADALDVSPDEAALLSEGRNSPFPPASKHGLFLPPVKPVPQAERRHRRRETLREMLAAVPDRAIPPTRILRDMLVAEGHKPATDKTLLGDLVAIGRPSPRSHKPRPQAAVQLQLPDSERV